MRRPATRGQHRGDTSGRRSESGFTIVETMVGLSLLFAVLTGAMATLGSTVKGVVDGRQRSGAVTVAREEIETARAGLYSQIGHDLGGDATLADDPAVTGVPKSFEGEHLVGASRPLFPNHRFTTDKDSTTYVVNVYVTWVTPASADPYKRVTVVVLWENAQHDPNLVSNEVRVSSLVFPHGIPPDPHIQAGVDVDAGTVKVTGQIQGTDLSRLSVFNSTAFGRVDSMFVRETSGSARSSRARLELNSGSASGCTVSEGGLLAECDGVRADTSTDSDSVTPPPENDVSGPTSQNSRGVAVGTGFGLSFTGNDAVTSHSTSRACTTCFSPTVGDDDRLAYHSSEGVGSGGTTVSFAAGGVQGSLYKTSGSSQASATIDQDVAADSQRAVATGTMSMPGADIVKLDGGPTDFAGAVRIGAVSATAQSEVGPTALSPQITGDPVSVQIYDTLADASLGYRSVSLEPGESSEETASAVFAIGDATVTLTTTVTSGGRAVHTTTDADGTRDLAEASLTNWLRVTVNLTVVEGGVTTVDTAVAVDYGRVTATALYEAS